MKERLTINSRRNIEMPCTARLTVFGGEDYEVKLSRISRHGARADLPSKIGPAEIPGSSKVQVGNFPEELQDLNQAFGTVIWITQGCCGIRFDSDLSGLSLPEAPCR